MISNTNINKNIKKSKSLIYRSIYSYKCNNNIVLSIVKKDNTQKSKDLRKLLTLRVKEYIIVNNLSE